MCVSFCPFALIKKYYRFKVPKSLSLLVYSVQGNFYNDIDFKIILNKLEFQEFLASYF